MPVSLSCSHERACHAGPHLFLLGRCRLSANQRLGRIRGGVDVGQSTENLRIDLKDVVLLSLLPVGLQEHSVVVVLSDELHPTHQIPLHSLFSIKFLREIDQVVTCLPFASPVQSASLSQVLLFGKWVSIIIFDDHQTVLRVHLSITKIMGCFDIFDALTYLMLHHSIPVLGLYCFDVLVLRWVLFLLGFLVFFFH